MLTHALERPRDLRVLLLLTDGGGLLYLLENRAGTRARIVMPEANLQ